MCVGPLKLLCHWGPITALSIIKIVSFTTIYCNNQLWPRANSLSWIFHSCLFPLLSAGTIYNFLGSVYNGPGFLPLAWRPEKPKDADHLQWCSVCKGYKAPRSHHCGRCILKMDHHCPWINSCVGHRNHANFTLFLFFAVCGCLEATFVLGSAIYYALYMNWFLYHGTGREPVVVLGLYFFILCVFSLGLAIGVVLAVGMLLYFQLRAIFRNRTAIEDWIVSKAVYRRELAEQNGEDLAAFIFPYHLGTWKNITQVLNASMTPVGDGIVWEVTENCTQFDLTREQKEQKSEKRQRSRPYVAVSCYSGYKLPVVHGIRVFCSPPCTDEARIPLNPGDRLVITRSTRNWLFGEKIKEQCDGLEVKGWFPRCCAIPVEGNDKKMQ